jgi:hypothetical protein
LNRADLQQLAETRLREAKVLLDAGEWSGSYYPESPLVDLLSMAIQTAADAVAGVRFSNNTINGHLIPDAYIYRLSRPLPERVAAG